MVGVKKTIILVAALAICSLGSTVMAADVLYFADAFVGTNYVLPALAAGGHTVTEATDWANFDTLLAGGSYDLAISLQQNDGAGGPDITGLDTYLTGGGRVIFTDWTQDTAYEGTLEFTYTGNTNQSDMTVSEPALLAGGLTNPIVLVNPGWGVFSMGLGGASLATFANGDDAITSGNGGQSLVLGFLADTPPVSIGQQLWENLIAYILGIAVAPVSNPIPDLAPVGRGILVLLVALSGAALIIRRL